MMGPGDDFKSGLPWLLQNLEDRCGGQDPVEGSPQKDESIPGKLFFLKICD